MQQRSSMASAPLEQCLAEGMQRLDKKCQDFAVSLREVDAESRKRLAQVCREKIHKAMSDLHNKAHLADEQDKEDTVDNVRRWGVAIEKKNARVLGEFPPSEDILMKIEALTQRSMAAYSENLLGFDSRVSAMTRSYLGFAAQYFEQCLNIFIEKRTGDSHIQATLLTLSHTNAVFDIVMREMIHGFEDDSSESLLAEHLVSLMEKIEEQMERLEASIAHYCVNNDEANQGIIDDLESLVLTVPAEIFIR